MTTEPLDGNADVTRWPPNANQIFSLRIMRPLPRSINVTQENLPKKCTYRRSRVGDKSLCRFLRRYCGGKVGGDFCHQSSDIVSIMTIKVKQVASLAAETRHSIQHAAFQRSNNHCEALRVPPRAQRHSPGDTVWESMTLAGRRRLPSKLPGGRKPPVNRISITIGPASPPETPPCDLASPHR